MIEPMLKYYLVVHHSDHEETMDFLRGLGLFHIRKLQDVDDEVRNQYKEIQTLKNFFEHLGESLTPAPTQVN
ncbi:hypothetical protein KFE98_11980 [bacterium SCSIO 12741]|nr:hypothetical protein KFE98_11980 [bacterium SCSIO 12741]